MIVPASSQSHHDSILWAFPFNQLEWELTPAAVQDYLKSQNQQIAQLQSQMAQFQSQIEQLQQHVETLQGRVAKTSQTSSKPPSEEAFWALIEEWNGILVSDGYGVYQDWVNQRQTCLAHLIRTARGLSQRRDPDIAACGHTALKELQRLCHMAHEPPTGGQWQAWYARFCRLLDRYQQRSDDAGRLVRRLAREMTSLGVFLREHGVDPTNNLAERGLRFGVMWRKTSHGTDSEQGNRWVERSLARRQTCRQLGQSTFSVLVDAVTSLFQGRQPDLAWLD